MRFEDKIISLASVDLSDHTFRITTEERIVELAESLKLPGLINTPLLIARGQKFTVISGFRRIKAGRYLGWSDMPARIAVSGSEKIECAQFAIADNALQRPLNLIEVSRALNLLSEFYHDPEKLAQTAASLALPGNPKVVQKIQSLCRLPLFVQELIAGGIISLSMALDLEKIDPEECTVFAGIFNELQLSLGKQRDIFALVKEIAVREEKNSLAVLAEAEVCRILSDSDSGSAQKASKLRSYLKKRRYPSLAEAEKRFEAFKKSLPVCNNFKFIPPADFEGTEHIVRLHFNCLDELRSHQFCLAGLIENDHFRKYWSAQWK